MCSTAALAILSFLALFNWSHGAIFVKIPGVDGEAPNGEDTTSFCADSFSMNIVREEKSGPPMQKGDGCPSRMKKPPKGEEFTIGTAKRRSFNITKRIDQTTPLLFRSAVTGNSVNDVTKGPCQFCITGGVDDDCDEPIDEKRCNMVVFMESCFVMNYAVGGSGNKGTDYPPTEEVAFYYNKIEVVYQAEKPLDKPGEEGSNPMYQATRFGWNNEECAEWTSPKENDPGTARDKHLSGKKTRDGQMI